MTEHQEQKQAAIDLLKERLDGKEKMLAEIDDRLLYYFADLCANSSADPDDPNDQHNVYELLGAAKFLRMLDTYRFNRRKVQTVIRLREGEWRQDEQGRWQHVSGGLKCPGTSGAQVYRWQSFQVFVLASVFGFYDWVDTKVSARDKAELLPTERERDGYIWDYRRVCTDFTYFGPRKTDKTGLAAYIQFVFFFFEDKNGEIYCCANSSDQAKLLYSRTRGLIAQMDDGNRIRSTQTVTDWRQAYKAVHDSSLRPLSAGGKTKDGMFAQLCCADEYGSAPYTNGKSDMLSLVNVIQSSMGPRREPMTFVTTTAGTISAGPFVEKLDALHRLLKHELTGDTSFEDDRRLCLCLEPDQWERDEHIIINKPSVRKKVNPMLGIIVQHSSYDAWIAEAAGDSTKMPELMAKLFNVYQSGHTVEWIKPDRIREMQRELRVDECTADKGWVAFGGLDFSMGDDLWAHTYLCINLHTGEFFADCDAWITQRTLEEVSIRPLYEKWIADGWLHVCPGEVIEPSIPIRRIMDLAGYDSEKMKIVRTGVNFMRFGYDQYKSPDPINLLKAWMYELGANPAQHIVPVPQTNAAFNQPVEQINFFVKASRSPLSFSMSPLWPYCFGCCVLDKDTRMENKKPIKRNSTDACKVDPVQALCDAFVVYNQVEGTEHPVE